MIDSAETLGNEVGLQKACKALGVSRATLQETGTGPVLDNLGGLR